MEYMYKKIKYVALIFFLAIFFIALGKQVYLFANNDLERAVFQNGYVKLLDDSGKEKGTEITAIYSGNPYDGKIIDVLYDKKEDKAYIVEWNHWLRNHLIVLMFVAVFIFLIKDDFKKEKEEKNKAN